MSRFTCTRRLTFCAGHRIAQHESKCAHLHGHNYVAWIKCGARNLDRAGRVVDFGVIKERVGGWIDKNWDHGMILEESDRAAVALAEAFSARVSVRQKLYLMDAPPTAENMAAELFRAAQPLLEPAGVDVLCVRLDETENCSAEWHPWTP